MQTSDKYKALAQTAELIVRAVFPGVDAAVEARVDDVGPYLAVRVDDRTLRSYLIGPNGMVVRALHKIISLRALTEFHERLPFGITVYGREDEEEA